MFQKIKEWAGPVALVIAIVAFVHAGAGNLGGVTNFDSLELSNGLYVSNASTTLIGKIQVGSSGTALKNRVEGQCYIYPYAASIAGSGVAQVDCQATAAAGTAGAIAALTGVQANDFVQINVSTTTAFNLATSSTITATNVTSPLTVVSAFGSTTAGYITLLVKNASTSPYVWPITGTASGTAFYSTARP
jgi:hypothetical protein